MDRDTVKSKFLAAVKKYRYAGIVILIGILFMALPTGTKDNTPSQTASAPQTPITTLEERLSSLLSQVSGAGNVQVILTMSSGEETLYQANEDVSTQENGMTTKTDTVTVTDAQRYESGLIRQVNPPVYKGAVIVCQGADNAAVRLAIVDAVGKATGLGADKISVLKMK